MEQVHRRQATLLPVLKFEDIVEILRVFDRSSVSVPLLRMFANMVKGPVFTGLFGASVESSSLAKEITMIL